MKRTPLLVLAMITACELTEVAHPPGRKTVVVQAVMRADLPQQWVLVEETLTGADPRQSTPGALPPDRPQLPVVGAQVAVDNVSFPGDPCGHPVMFDRAPPPPPTPNQFAVDGVYWGPRNCPTLRPGDSVTLRVETNTGAVVTGYTKVVGASGFSLDVGGTVRMLPDSMFDFNRDHDTLIASAVDPVGRAVQVDFRKAHALTGFDGSTNRITSLFVDSTHVTLPGNLTDVFVRGTGDFVFHPGRQYQLGVSLTDRHLFDFIRSANGPITGTGFINHLEGGIGVFGSAVAAATPVRIVSDQDDNREGRYRIRGTITGFPVDTACMVTALNIPIDTEWDVYLLRDTRDSISASAFVTGDWLFGDLDGTTGLAEGFFWGDEFQFKLTQELRDPCLPQAYIANQFSVRGFYQPGSFSVQVLNGIIPIGTLSATR